MRSVNTTNSSGGIDQQLIIDFLRCSHNRCFKYWKITKITNFVFMLAVCNWAWPHQNCTLFMKKRDFCFPSCGYALHPALVNKCFQYIPSEIVALLTDSITFYVWRVTPHRLCPDINLPHCVIGSNDGLAYKGRLSWYRNSQYIDETVIMQVVLFL